MTIALGREHGATTEFSTTTATVIHVGQDRHARRLTERLMAVAREISPRKTAAFLSDICGVPIRTAERWLADEATVSFLPFVRMMWCEHGDKFQDAVMPDVKDKNCPAYWRRRKKVQAIAAAKRETHAALKRINQLEIDFANDE